MGIDELLQSRSSFHLGEATMHVQAHHTLVEIYLSTLWKHLPWKEFQSVSLWGWKLDGQWRQNDLLGIISSSQVFAKRVGVFTKTIHHIYTIMEVAITKWTNRVVFVCICFQMSKEKPLFAVFIKRNWKYHKIVTEPRITIYMSTNVATFKCCWLELCPFIQVWAFSFGRWTISY